MRPLDGITVLALEHAVSAPFATRHLADLGARVIKVERPEGGDFARGYDETVRGLSSYFVWINRSKESLTLNLKHPRAKEIIARLLGRADVFVQNLAPGATGRLGLQWEELLARHPRLIVCDISGYGDSGPYRDRKAYDLLIQSEAGFLSVSGTADTPCKAGISIADIAAGTYAYSGILGALYQRERTGKGMRIEVSMLEALGEWMGFPLYYAHYGGAAPSRTGASHATIYPYGPFRAGDGKSVMLGVQNEREWAEFCDVVLGCPEMARDPRFDSNSRRVANREALVRGIDKVFSGLTAEEIVRRLDAAQIANARMNDMEAVWNHPQLAARGRWRKVSTPAGTVSALLPPATLSTCEARLGGVPALGEHTDAVLAELGFSLEEIAALRAESAV
ncbi:MAG TPA: CaiB/BaiF CoA-transferase family protein [Candidatus Methylomirabilis sp.]|nr:CaiB/BaiF CoA-transferase family protein [Candidatus Methylomirabilis sp.]